MMKYSLLLLAALLSPLTVLNAAEATRPNIVILYADDMGYGEVNWEARPGPMTPGWDFYAVGPSITDKAVEWIGKQRGKDVPFLLYSPFNSPHAPIVPTNDQSLHAYHRNARKRLDFGFSVTLVRSAGKQLERRSIAVDKYR